MLGVTFWRIAVNIATLFGYPDRANGRQKRGPLRGFPISVFRVLNVSFSSQSTAANYRRDRDSETNQSKATVPGPRRATPLRWGFPLWPILSQRLPHDKSVRHKKSPGTRA